MLGVVAHAYFTLSSPVGSDALLSATGTMGGAAVPIVLRSPPVPVLPGWGRAQLVLVVLGVAVLAARNRLRMRGVLALCLIAGAASPTLVRAALGDGTLRSWSAVELVAVDPPGDAPEGADILAAFAFVDENQGLLFVRVDAFFGPAICLDWPTVDPGTGYSCNQEPPPDAGPFGNRVALTFDDGPNLATTPTIVDTLRNEGVPATFFMVGNRLETSAARALALEIHQDPLFEIANHSYSHPRFTTLSIDQARSQVGTTNGLLQLAVGDACHYPSFFRIPYSASNCMSAGVVREYGLSMVGFHVDTLDWCYAAGNGYCSPANASYLPTQYRNDMVGWTLTRLALYGGGVVIMHDSQANTMAQLPALIAALRGAGVTFVRLDDSTVFPLINAAVNPPEAPACCEF
jgi:peptidoglycan/xylan/chitin deacetylase (PgdA/CDA1 family)